jgi:hypothetical protein
LAAIAAIETGIDKKQYSRPAILVACPVTERAEQSKANKGNHGMKRQNKQPQPGATPDRRETSYASR